MYLNAVFLLFFVVANALHNEYQPLNKVTLPSQYQTTCNDGSPYVYYIRRNESSSNWLFFLQGGAWCFDLYSCTERWHDSPRLMSSKNSSDVLGGGYGIISSLEEYNPLFYTWNTVFFPYCTSDDFSGNSTSNDTPWVYLGSRVVPSVTDHLMQTTHLKNAPSTTVVFSGSSAGGEGLLPNIQRLKTSILTRTSVLGLDDSGWFLDSIPYKKNDCKDDGSCTEQAGLEKGVKLWNPVVNEKCAQRYTTLWQCLMAYYTKPFITVPMFVFQWRFDSAQMGHDGITQNPSNNPAELAYAQKSAHNLTHTMTETNQQTYFLPSCYYHTILQNVDWQKVTISGVTLPEAVSRFLRGEHLKLADTCDTPNCSSFCP